MRSARDSSKNQNVKATINTNKLIINFNTDKHKMPNSSKLTPHESMHRIRENI